MSGKSVVIIGGGVIGLCTAWYAMKEGHRVTVIERGAPTHDACSLGNAGMIVPSHFVPLAAPGMVGYGLRMLRNPESPFAIKPRLDPDLMRWGLAFMRAANAAHVERSAPLLRDMNLLSRAEYERFAAERGNDFGLVTKGLLMLCKSEHTLHEEAKVAETARGLGVPAEVLTPEELAKLDPNVTMDVAGGVYFPRDAHLNPAKFVAGLTRDLDAGGAKFVWNAEATGWRQSGGCIEAVQTGAGDVAGDEFVLAGGSWSSNVLRPLGVRLPMQAGKGYSVTLERPRQQPELCAILTEARVAVTPMSDTLRFAGTMEIGGLDTSVNPRRVEGIVKSVPTYYPAFRPDDLRGLPVWSGLRPCSPDGLPYVGRFRHFRNLSAATGHAMMGLSLGPVTGKLMADVLANRAPALDIAPLSPDRYA